MTTPEARMLRELLSGLRLSMLALGSACQTRRWGDAEALVRRIRSEVDEVDTALRTAIESDRR